MWSPAGLKDGSLFEVTALPLNVARSLLLLWEWTIWFHLVQTGAHFSSQARATVPRHRDP